MATNYDEIAEDYLKGKTHPIKMYIESFTLLKVLGDVQGKSVLDLACGDGYYTRLVKMQGAAPVIGVDISEAMITHAEAIEVKAPLGIEYRLHDVTNLEQIGHFDIITAIYLFPYVPTKQALAAMCHSIYENLRPGGKLVSITLDPNLSAEDLTIYGQYGVNISTEEDVLQDSTTIKAIINVPNSSFELSNFYWRQDTYERVLQQVGFQGITWHRMEISEEGTKVYGEDYWQAFLAKPYGIILECYK
jgi:toxoflavin synthase